MLGTSDPLTCVAVLFLLLFVSSSRSPAFVMSVLVGFSEHLQSHRFLSIQVHLFSHLGSQCSLDRRNLVKRQVLGELDAEKNKQVSSLVASLVEGHAEAFDCLDVFRFDDLTRLILYSDFPSVEMCQHEVHSCECLQQSDLLFK